MLLVFLYICCLLGLIRNQFLLWTHFVFRTQVNQDKRQLSFRSIDIEIVLGKQRPKTSPLL